ncbi:TPA: hypothetical protein QCX34_005801 [Bacillus anthracis]|uniref:hypothetical protein n=1 Tax=Bacillus TaxID=1386 RepID=UPI0013EEB477|nr:MULTISPECIES: hypothetical protein [Bacillus]KAF6544867.1 hypothetical protein G9F74_28695 [Bacillus sp. EKM202B]MDF9451754.1 hypothetical protein [Bacillus toyonensis]MDG1563981.1 hypothetical protein [Bacillus toyonensis]HDR7438142.1 hypothetical protein [Bacillus anthracis]
MEENNEGKMYHLVTTTSDKQKQLEALSGIVLLVSRRLANLFILDKTSTVII